jgi:nitrogen fixation NifU-like protein
MINSKIIKIASNTKYEGLKNIFTHKSSIKNSLCGDFIKVEFIANKSKIKSMRYETESCILCEASASLLASKIKKLYLKDIKKDIENLKKIKKNKNLNFPLRFKELKQLLNKQTLKRINCVILPMEALSKAFKISK